MDIRKLKLWQIAILFLFIAFIVAVASGVWGGLSHRESVSQDSFEEGGLIVDLNSHSDFVLDVVCDGNKCALWENRDALDKVWTVLPLEIANIDSTGRLSLYNYKSKKIEETSWGCEDLSLKPQSDEKEVKE